MNLSRPFIKRPVMTSLVMVAILFFGIVAYRALPISDLPQVAFPTIMVQVNNPGSDPNTMAATVATPLEQQMMQISGLKQIVSASKQGQTTINLTFDLKKDIVAAETEVAAAITRAQGNLPAELPQPPTYKQYSPTASPILYISCSSQSMTQADIYNYAFNVVAQQFNMLSGVAEVDVYGSPKAVRVKLDADKIASYGLGINEVANAIKGSSQLLPGGQVYDSYQNFNIEPLGQLEQGEEYTNQIIAFRDGAPIRVGDIGEGYDDVEQQDFYLKYWHKEMGSRSAVVVAIQKQGDANTVGISNQIHKMLPMLRAQLPPSIDLDIIYDYSVLIEESVWDVKFTLVVAFALVVLVIFMFLGHLTSTIIPVITLPMTLIGTFLLMFLFGFSIDILSMMALTLVIGFLVDDAIVVLENIVRHVQMGKTPLEAALDGSKQISTTVLSMSLSLSAIFIPIIFMPGIVGRMFHEFGVVIVLSVLVSGFISLTLTPMCCAKALKQNRTEGKVERAAKNLTKKLLSWYEPALKWCLRRRIVPVVLTAGAFVVGMVLFFELPGDFLPPGDTGVIQGIVIAPQDASPLAMGRIEEKLTNIFEKNDYINSLIGVANVPMFLNANEGFLYSNLIPIQDRPPIGTVIKQLYEAMAPEVVGVNVFLQPLPEINFNVSTSTTRANYMYVLSTVKGADELYMYAKELTRKMRELPELTQVSSDVQDESPQLNIHILRDQAATYQVDVDDIENALDLAYAGSRLWTYSTDINTFWIIVQMNDNFRLAPDSLNHLYIAPKNSSGREGLVPLQSVVSVEKTIGPITVYHDDQFTAATIYFDLAAGAALGDATAKVEQLAEELLPEYITKRFEGTAQVFQQTIPEIILLMFVGIVVIYIILGILYESFIHPITILSALPGAIFGGLLTLAIFGETLSLYAYIGLIVLIGIVMKNGIMLIEFANEEVNHGAEPFDAIVAACKVRFRPILMTTIAAAMGALPIAIGIGAGAGSRRPIGLCILGGLLFSQLVTYFFTPVVYLTFENIRKRRRKT